MTNTIQQLEDLKEWSQDSARYERRLNFRGAGLVQPRQGFYKKGFVKQKPTAEQSKIAKKFYKKPFLELGRHERYRITTGQTTAIKPMTKEKEAYIKTWEENTGKNFKDLKDKRLKSKIRQGIQTGEGRGQVQPTKGLSKYSDIELNKAAKEIYGVDSWKDAAITSDQRTVLRENLRKNKGKFVKSKGIDYEKRTLKDAKKFFNTLKAAN